MKNIFVLYIFIMLLSSCKEEPPTIDFSDCTDNDTGLVDSSFVRATPSNATPRVVLLEDFTGVRCVNCPDAQKKAKAFATANPGRVVLMANYTSDPNSLTRPYLFGSNLDLRTREATDLYALLGKSLGLPSGSIDRVWYPGEAGILIGNSDNWAGYGNQRLPTNAPFNIEITNTYDAASRSAKIRLVMECTKVLTDTLSFTLGLLENGLIAPQETRTDIDTFYEHEHVLRTLLTPYIGRELTGPFVSGKTYIKEFRYTLPANWNESKIYVVAFVHKSGTGKEVHQAAEKKLLP